MPCTLDRTAAFKLTFLVLVLLGQSVRADEIKFADLKDTVFKRINTLDRGPGYSCKVISADAEDDSTREYRCCPVDVKALELKNKMSPWCVQESVLPELEGRCTYVLNGNYDFSEREFDGAKWSCPSRD